MKTLNKTLLARAVMMTLASGSFAVAGAGGSKFDASSLLNTGISTEDISAERVLIPEGDWKFRVGTPDISSGTDDKGKNWAKVTIPLTLTDREALEATGAKELRSRYTFFLDLTEEGGLATGVNMNTRLAGLFAACGLEGDEVSISETEGKEVYGKVVNKVNQTSGTPFDEVTNLAYID